MSCSECWSAPKVGAGGTRGGGGGAGPRGDGGAQPPWAGAPPAGDTGAPRAPTSAAAAGSDPFSDRSITPTRYREDPNAREQHAPKQAGDASEHPHAA